MSKKNIIIFIFDYLKELFPDPETELHYSTPFQFVVAVMLSAQATDLQVNKVTNILFKIIKKSEDLLTMWFAPFERAISSINYYHSKAKHIYQTASLLMNNEKWITLWLRKGQVNDESKKNYIDWIPNTLEELMKLPWVGVKTGKLIAHVLYNELYIAVDTHIHRVSNRLWILLPYIPSKIKGTKRIGPEKTSELLEKLVPDSYKDHAHHSLVLFWRYYCKAKNPLCSECKLQKICKYYKTSVIASKTKQS